MNLDTKEIYVKIWEGEMSSQSAELTQDRSHVTLQWWRMSYYSQFWLTEISNVKSWFSWIAQAQLLSISLPCLIFVCSHKAERLQWFRKCLYWTEADSVNAVHTGQSTTAVRPTDMFWLLGCSQCAHDFWTESKLLWSGLDQFQFRWKSKLHPFFNWKEQFTQKCTFAACL